ncbi:MAG: hypothetical protein MJ223_03460 [Mycoplasmoidaceae bacterium]|nr:hypothetical protein [Mycoplasmoidaceae bacterium]
MFGGIPDGEPVNEAGLVDYSTNKPMLEIKTSSIDKLSYKTQKGIMHMQKDANGLPLVKVPGEKKLS